MADSTASQGKLTSAERRVKALELRKAGKTYREIGATLGFTEQRAHQIVTDELRRLNTQRAESAGEVCRLENERLDAMLGGIWEKAQTGDLGAIGKVLNIMERRATMTGIDAPKRKEVTGADGGPQQHELSGKVSHEHVVDPAALAAFHADASAAGLADLSGHSGEESVDTE